MSSTDAKDALASQTAERINRRLAAELAVRPEQVSAAVDLLDGGSTVPFIARYRKEVTGGLDDTQLRTLEERLAYLREMEDRRQAILKSIEEQGKLTPELTKSIGEADTKQRLEDIYLPYKPKRRTKAMIAREAGLEPLAEALLVPQMTLAQVQEKAGGFLNADAGFADVKAVLEGARHILAERWAEDADLVGRLRAYVLAHGRLASTVVKGQETEGAKFSDYFDFSELLRTIPSHRALALFRGRNEGVLDLKVTVGEAGQPDPCEAMVAAHAKATAAHPWLLEAAGWTWRVKIGLSVELDAMTVVRERAEEEAIRVFGRNLHDLLLAPPAGQKATMGLDPGIRTGVKVAVVDATGKLLDTATIYPHAPRHDWEGSITTLATLAAQHHVALISIGNGTASRETDRLAADLMQQFPDLHLTKVTVSEAGASVYSASATAAAEFPDLDVSLRGAVSIARRLQDPLAELVKIEPKSIGVGQYQHDVSQPRLAQKLDGVVEDCVNSVGVDLNTASVPLLARVAGLNETVAHNVVSFRDAQGAFKTRRELLKVARLGPKAFEQAAGFLRIVGGDNPLDASAVHPEAYPVVERILAKAHKKLADVVGDTAFLRSLDPRDFTDETFGVPTVTDILRELEKPGRDPRPAFKTATFQEGINEPKDLKAGMILEGTVTNVAAFGAFVDIGVHQDGLVHISQLSHTFVKDPHTVVKAGDIVKVKVVEVDLVRKRIGLTMKLDEPAHPQGSHGPHGDHKPHGGPAPHGGDHRGPRDHQHADRYTPAPKPAPKPTGKPTPESLGALAEAFSRAKDKGRK